MYALRGYQKPLAQCGMEELAARQQSIRANGAVQFARSDGEQKTAARQLIIDLFTPEAWPQKLHMLTMPGVTWRLERKILGRREERWLRKPHPERTYFTACENDRAIFYAAVAQMPGLHNYDAEMRWIKRHFDFAEMGVKTKYASIFHANMDDFLAHHWDGGWDAVWLDYIGPLTVERLELIARFYQQHVKSILIVTALKARWNQRTTSAIDRADGHSNWLRQQLHGEILHDIEYFDTSPMAQFAVRQQRWVSPLT